MFAYEGQPLGHQHYLDRVEVRQARALTLKTVPNAMVVLTNNGETGIHSSFVYRADAGGNLKINLGESWRGWYGQEYANFKSDVLVLDSECEKHVSGFRIIGGQD